MTPLYPQKLALTSPTGGGRSVGIVRSRTKATEFSLEFTELPDRLCAGLFPGDKAKEREGDHSYSPKAKVRNEWSYTSVPSIRFHGVDRVNFGLPFVMIICCVFLVLSG